MADPAVVIIPARGGSKRFPRKNIAPLAGKPLLGYAIKAANAASLILGTYLTTEDEEIAKIAKECGAQVPYLRPLELSGDLVTADEAVAHMIRYLQDKQKLEFSIAVLIQPTSPFVRPSHIDAAVKKLRDEPDLDSVTTMSLLDHRQHPYNLSFVGENGRWEFLFSEERAKCRHRQGKPTTQKFCNLFAARCDTFLSKGRFGVVKGSIIVDSIYAWDIDHEWDLKLAEAIIEKGLVDLTY